MKLSTKLTVMLHGSYMAKRIVGMIKNGTTTPRECVGVMFTMGLRPSEVVYMAIKTKKRITTEGENYLQQFATLRSLKCYNDVFNTSLVSINPRYK